jgi:hypothetical protein
MNSPNARFHPCAKTLRHLQSKPNAISGVMQGAISFGLVAQNHLPAILRGAEFRDRITFETNVA